MVFATTLTLVLAGLAGLIVLGNRYRLTPKNLKLPFMDFEASCFGDLSVVRLFDEVSAKSIPSSQLADKWLALRDADISPLMLIHLGWHIVCNAFVSTYLAYPTPEAVMGKVGDLGTQDAEFVLLFERIYKAAIGQAGAIPFGFAVAYFQRAPSLAERITKRPHAGEDELFMLISGLLPHSENFSA